MSKRRRFGSIRRLPSGRWQASYSTRAGRRVTAPGTFAQKLHAEAWLADRRREIDRGLWDPGAQTSIAMLQFADYVTQWLAARDLRPRTREEYRRVLEHHLIPVFGECSLEQITPADVRAWYATLLPGRPTIRARAYSLLRTVMGTAVADELIPSNPCRLRGAGQAARVHRIRPATVAELDALTEAMPDRLKLAVPLASWCALRVGEILELRRADIDLGAEVIRVRRAVVQMRGRNVIGLPKSAAGVRDVSIPPHLLTLVKQHLQEYVGPHDDSLLFPKRQLYKDSSRSSVDDSSTMHLVTSSLYRAWDRARRAAGRPDLRFHDLRHTGLVLAAVAGATLSELMGRAGHSSVAAAVRYQHVAAGRERELAGLLSKLADDKM